MAPLIIGLIVAAVIALAAYFALRAKKCAAPQDCPSGKACAPGGTCKALPSGWSAEPTAVGVWSPNAFNEYTCPGSIAPGYCVLPDVWTATDYCQKDPACAGYLVSEHPDWTPASVQLTSAQPVPSEAWAPNAFRAKLAP